jgi:hypothetical protein
MPKSLYNLYYRNTRLLVALMLIVVMLCNSIGMVQAHSMTMKKDCCPEMMMAHEMPIDAMQDNANDCPETISDCDALCMASCMSASYVLIISPTLIPNSLGFRNVMNAFVYPAHTLAEFGPGLRPPIYS